MNRQQRRAEKHRKFQYERTIPLPRMLDEWTIFDCPQRIINTILTGEVPSIMGKPVFLDNQGDWCEVCPALSGWIFTWQRIIDRLGHNASLIALGKLHNKLQADMPLQTSDVHQALDELNILRNIFRQTDRQLIKSIAQDAQIAIFMQDEHQKI